MSQIYKSAKGKIIDYEAIRLKNEKTVATGNTTIPVNARGDQLGKDGKIIKSRNEIMQEYYATNPKAVSHTKTGSVQHTPAQQEVTQQATTQSSLQKISEESSEISEEESQQPRVAKKKTTKKTTK